MASQTTNNLEEVELPQPFMLRDILPGAGWAPYQRPVRGVVVEINRSSRATSEDVACVKGLLVGVFLEGVAGLGVFGLWHLWHLIR